MPSLPSFHITSSSSPLSRIWCQEFFYYSDIDDEVFATTSGSFNITRKFPQRKGEVSQNYLYFQWYWKLSR